MNFRRAVRTSMAAVAPVVWAVVVAGGGVQDKLRVNPDAALSVEFLKGVQAYVELHQKLEATLPQRPEHGTPQEITAYEDSLARLIVAARSNARQGDLLSQKVRSYFRRQIGGVLRGPDGAAIRHSVLEENPGKVALRVNARYPDGVPLSTVPSQVLGALPKLPPHIEYRFIGDRLLLLDVHSQLVVDYMSDALPS
jgi:hypothetical protein